MKKQYLTIVILFFLLLVLPLALILVKKRAKIRPKAAFGTVNLALTPPALTKNLNEEFEIEVQIIQPQPPTSTPTPTSTPAPPTSTPTPSPSQPTATPTPLPRLTPTLTPTPTLTSCAKKCQERRLCGGVCKNLSEIEKGDKCFRESSCPLQKICCCQKCPLPTLTPTPTLISQNLLKPAYAQGISPPFKISAADISLSFDKEILKVTNVTAGQQFTNLVLKEIKNNQGRVRFSVIAKKPTDQLPQAEVITAAKITFKGKKAGTSSVSFTAHKIVGYNEQNEDVSLDVDQKTEGSYTISGQAQVYLKFKIKFRGMQGTENALPVLKVRLRVVDENQIEEPKFDFEDIEVEANKDKVYSPKDWVPLPGIAPGPNYTLLVKGPKHLQKRMEKRIRLFKGKNKKNSFDWTTATPKRPEPELDPGDLPDPNKNFSQDGVCNAHDISLILERLGRSDEEALKVADVNYDNFVNLTDYSLVLQTLRTRYEDEE